MNSWKDDKDQGPWEFSKSGADNRYNEGNLVATSANAVWSLERTGIPVTPDHNPCGYWLKGYVPNTVVTSKPYPVILLPEDLEIKDFDVIAGVFRQYLRGYSLQEDLEIKDFDVTAGVFRAAIIEYSLQEDLEIKDFDLTAGVFRAAIIEYSNGVSEDLEIKDFDVTAGVFRVGLISYSNGISEDLEIKDFDVTGGTHATA